MKDERSNQIKLYDICIVCLSLTESKIGKSISNNWEKQYFAVNLVFPRNTEAFRSSDYFKFGFGWITTKTTETINNQHFLLILVWLLN